MFLGYKRIQGDKLFQLMGFFSFIILTLFLVSEYQVTYTETMSTSVINATNGKTVTTSTDTKTGCIVCGNTSWLGWIFFILAMVNVAMFIMYYKQDKEYERRIREMDL